MKPMIAVTSFIYGLDSPMKPSRYLLPALERCGALGFFTGPLAGAADAAQVTEAFDGLLLGGGGDINPEFLGQPPHPANVCVDRERDLTELALARAFMASGKPILAVCRGCQVLNVAMGGTHDQHIFDRLEVTIAHQDAATRHPVRVLPGTHLSRIFGGAQTLTVNSTHHQAVQTLAPGFVPSAYSPDGVLEGFERGERVVAVQFHPERMLDEGLKPLFDWFVQACRQ